MQVSVDVINNIDSIIEKLSQSNIDKGMYYMLDAQALPDMNNYVPNAGGELRTSGHVENNDTLVWDTPYAGVQYAGTAGKPPGIWYSDKQRKWFFANMIDENGNYLYEGGYTTPGTGPEWDAVAYAAHGDSWMNAFLEGAGLL